MSVIGEPLKSTDQTRHVSKSSICRTGGETGQVGNKKKTDTNLDPNLVFGNHCMKPLDLHESPAGV